MPFLNEGSPFIQQAAAPVSGIDARDPQSSIGSSRRKVTIVGTGEQFECRTDESVLAGLARTGRRGIPVGCRGGGCGVCKIIVVSGEYLRQKMSADHVDAKDLEHHRVLACRISAVSNLEIRVLGRMANSVQRLVGDTAHE